MARVLGVSQARFYARRPRPPPAHARADEALLAQIKRVHISSRQTYGAPRVDAELRATGERHGRKRIARLMRAAGLVGAGADALNIALGQRRPREVIHHSDQGSQYTSLAFGKRCMEAGVRLSMGSVGDAYDNALCESFFATL